MEQQTINEPSSDEEKGAAARSRTYELFARLFEYPDKEFGEAIRSGELAAKVRETLRALDPTHVYTQYESAGVPDRLREIAADRSWHLEDSLISKSQWKLRVPLNSIAPVCRSM